MTVRIGLIVPSSNTVAEVDFYRHLPEVATLHTARMYLEETTPEAETVMLEQHLPIALADLATTRPDVVVFACTSAGTLRGNRYEEELIDQIAERANARPVSVAHAVRQAIASRGAKRVGVITPYVESLNDKIRSSLEEEGLEVVGVHGLGIRQNLEIGAVEPEQIVEFALERFRPREVELLFASCTNWRALEAREQLERELQVPVLTSNHAALEVVLTQIGSSSTV
jgi:maleate isomerase